MVAGSALWAQDPVPVTTQNLKLQTSSRNEISITPPAATTGYSLVLPLTAGANGSVLTSNGSGTLSWVLPSATSWSLLGNDNVDSTLNFLGTTNGRPLILKANNAEAFRIRSTGQVLVTSLNGAAATSMPSGFDRIVIASSDGELNEASIATVVGAGIEGNAWSLSGNTTTTAWNGTSGTYLGTKSTQPLVIATTNATAQDIRFYTGANGATERLRIKSTGELIVSDLGGVTPSGPPIPGGYDRVIIANSSGQLDEVSIPALFSASGWALSGNSGLTSGGALGATATGTGKLGMTDGVDLRLITDGKVRMIIASDGAITMGSTLGVTGLITGSAGATISGAATSINASSNFNTNINTGTSTGTVAIGNSASTTTILGATTINSTGTAATSIGNATGTFALTSPGLNVATSGDLSDGGGNVVVADNLDVTGTGTNNIGVAASTNTILGTTAITGATTINTTGTAATTIGNTTAATAVTINSGATGGLTLGGIPTGTASDDVLLINASSKVTKTTRADLIASTAWALVGNSTTTAWNGTSGSFLGTTSTQPLVLATTNATAQDIRFYTGASGASERMRVTSDGRVGIRETAPDAILHVTSPSNTNIGVIIQASTLLEDIVSPPPPIPPGGTTANLLEFRSEADAVLTYVTAKGSIVLKAHGAAAGETNELLFRELNATGENYVGFKAPDAISADVVWTLPSADGTSNQALTTNGSKILSWTSVLTPSTGWATDGNDISASSGALGVAPTGSWLGTKSSSTAKDLRIATNGLTRMIVASDGGITMGSTLGVTGLITGNAGADISGAATSINASSNNNTNINTGTSTGTVAIGNSASTTTILGATTINSTGTAATTIGNTTAATAVTINSGSTGGLTLGGIPTGTASDDVLLINASNKVTKTTRADLVAGTAWALAGNSTTTAWNGTSGSFLGTTSAQPLVIATTNATSQDIRFFTGTNGVLERLRILGTGFVGIGIAAPTAQLEIQPSATSFVGLVIRAQPSQSAPIFAVRNSSSVDLVSVAPSGQLVLSPISAAAGGTNQLRFEELSANGSEYVGFKAPDAIATTRVWTLPNADGSSGQFLSTNGSGTLSWATALTATSGWSLTGNASTDSTAAFIGTTDETVGRPLVIKTDGVERARFTGGNGYLGVGTSAPTTSVDINGAIRTRPGTATANGANTAVTVGNKSFIVITSDDVFASRRVTLSDGQDGQRLMLLVLGAGGDNTYGVRLETTDANLRLNNDAELEDGDTIELVFYGTNWFELKRSVNSN